MNQITNEKCKDCGGTGEVLVSAPVYPGESHTAYIDTAPCMSCFEGEEDRT